MQQLAVRAFAVVAYLAFVAVFTYFIGFVAGVVVPRGVDDGGALAAPLALAIDLALVAFFGVAHSVMARARWKRALTRVVPAAAERSLYVLVASLQMALVCWQWRPIGDGVLWSVGGALALALRGFAMLGWSLVLAASFSIDHAELFGLAQAFGARRGATALRTPLLYRWVRHPLYLGLLIGLWSAPVMSAGHLALAGLFTAYIAIGVRHEERDLVRTFGDDYRRYQARVPMLLPLRVRRGADFEIAS